MIGTVFQVREQTKRNRCCLMTPASLWPQPKSRHMKMLLPQVLLRRMGLLSSLMEQLHRSCKLAAAQTPGSQAGSSAALSPCFARFVGTLLLSTGPAGCTFEGGSCSTTRGSASYTSWPLHWLATHQLELQCHGGLALVTRSMMLLLWVHVLR